MFWDDFFFVFVVCSLFNNNSNKYMKNLCNAYKEQLYIVATNEKQIIDP